MNRREPVRSRSVGQACESDDRTRTAKCRAVERCFIDRAARRMVTVESPAQSLLYGACPADGAGSVMARLYPADVLWLMAKKTTRERLETILEKNPRQSLSELAGRVEVS